MPLITGYSQVKDVYGEAAELGVALPVFCAEDRETLEAILAAALEVGREIGREDLPVIPAWTCRYPARPQMQLLTACGDPALGTELMFSDLSAFAAGTSPYRKLRIMPHLDHAFPWLDRDVLEGCADRFASVMCDASERPFEENIRLTAEYVEKIKGQVVIEGAVDEIFEAGNQAAKNELTTVKQARKFLDQTGVDFIVPNVGTEHRLTNGQAFYRRDRAREISANVGKVLCLHGTSSLKPEELPGLPADGFIKVNIYTTLAVHGGQVLTRKVLNNLGNIFTEEELDQLVKQGVLGEKTTRSDYGENKPPVRPKLDCVANPPRRDAWFNAVKEKCKDFMRVLQYQRFAG